MSLIGKKVSDFKVQAYVNGEFKEVTQEDILGRWSVFFFYPADFTFVCPTELEDLANKYEEFQKIGCDVYSVSCDTHYVHKAWHDASERIQKIQYPMLADPTGKLARDFDVMIEEDGLAERGDFIVNPQGEICDDRRRRAGRKRRFYRESPGRDRGLRGDCRKCRKKRRRDLPQSPGFSVRSRTRR